MADTPTTPATEKQDTTNQKFKVSDVRQDDVVILMEDGRAFPVAKPEGLSLKRGQEVKLKFVELDKDGVPKEATITNTVG